jgi:hypothetical protein
MRDPRQMLQRAAAGQGDAEFCAGYFYVQGAAGVAKNPAEGVRYFRRAAEHGHVKANGYLGYLYKHGIGVAPDLREAERWYRRGAELGDPGAQNDLAVLLLDGGDGVKSDLNEAIKWVRLAAQQNYPQAFNLLARIQATSQPPRKEPAQDLVDEGRRLFTSGDRPGAAKPFLAAAQAGHSGAQLQIGWHYEKGVGVSQSYAEAARWYHKSAEQGNSTAMKNLGQLYEEGLGVPEDWTEAPRAGIERARGSATPTERAPWPAPTSSGWGSPRTGRWPSSGTSARPRRAMVRPPISRGGYAIPPTTSGFATTPSSSSSSPAGCGSAAR